MTKTIRKLQQINERLWNVTTLTAAVAASLGRDGRPIAVLCDETRRMAQAVNAAIDKTLDGGELNMKDVQNMAFQLNFIALNGELEAHRLDTRGGPAAVCAEEIRALATAMQALSYPVAAHSWDAPLRNEADLQNDPVWPKNPLTSMNQNRHTFMCFSIGGHYIVENFDFVLEVAPPHMPDYLECLYEGTAHMKWRKKELPVIDTSKLLCKSCGDPSYIFIKTPWAPLDQTYAVVVDTIYGAASFPFCAPVPPPADNPLSPFVRECWENENGPPVFFMDWAKMA